MHKMKVEKRVERRLNPDELLNQSQRMTWTHYCIGMLIGFLSLVIGPLKVMLFGHIIVIISIAASWYLHPKSTYFAAWPLAILAGIFTNISVLFVLYKLYAMTLPYDILVPIEICAQPINLPL